MRSFLLVLFLLSLMTGCEAGSEVKGCAGGWVEFTCKYPISGGGYQSIDVVNPIKTTLQSTEKAVWEEKGRVSLYHDRKKKNLRVAIQQLEREDFGEYKCEFYQSSTSHPETVELELEVETDGCQGQSTQTAYRTAKTTITCDYPGNKYKPRFFCKENGFICEDILSTKSTLKSNGTFTLTETNRGFSVSISNVSSHHAGVYWCGGDEGSYRTALRKITLEVKVSSTVPSVSSTSPVCSTQSTTASAESRGGSRVAITVIVWVAVLLLLFVLILILIYKRKRGLLHSKNARNKAAAKQIKEDYVYEEIQKRAQKPDSGNAMNTIYVTANFPTNPSDSLHYSTINFHNSLDKADGEALILKPSSAACEYSTVKHSQSPTYSTVNRPSRSSEDPLYSTVNLPRQQ